MSHADTPEQIIDEQTFEAALEKLQQLVRDLEAGDVPLEKSILAFEEGQKLIKFCQDKLTGAEKALRELSTDLEPVLSSNKSKG